MRPSASLLVVGLVGAAVSVACRETVSPGPPAENLVPFDGDGQSAHRLDTLPQPLVVRVVDDGGEAVSGVQVTWSVSDEHGTVIPIDETTDDDGRARVTVILGFALGVQHVEARAVGFDDVARFTATATSAPGFKAVSLMRHSGAAHTCAIDFEQRAWCWGYNGAGELGNGSLEPSVVPQLVTTTERFTGLWGASGITCGLTPDMRLLCWGANQVTDTIGRFGNGSIEGSLAPVAAGGGLSFSAFALGSTTACGLTLTGQGYCWGAGSLGNGERYSESSVPVPLAGGGVWREIVTDDQRGCAVSDEGVVHCWAQDDAANAIGVDESTVFVPTPVLIVPALSNLSIGWYNQCGMGGAGAVCWGEWDFATPIPNPPGPSSPRPSGENFERILAGDETLMGRSASGRLWIWGGHPAVYDGWISSTPVALKPAGPWLDFAIGHGPYGILASDSTVWRWPYYALDVFLDPDEASLLPVPVPPPPGGSAAD